MLTVGKTGVQGGLHKLVLFPCLFPPHHLYLPFSLRFFLSIFLIFTCFSLSLSLFFSLSLSLFCSASFSPYLSFSPLSLSLSLSFFLSLSLSLSVSNLFVLATWMK